MSTNSDVLMQQFRDSVYSRYKAEFRGIPPADLIKRRATSAQKWHTSTAAASPPKQLDPEFLRQWVVADVVSLRDTPVQERKPAFDAIYQNISINSSYATVLGKIDKHFLEHIKVLHPEHIQTISAAGEHTISAVDDEEKTPLPRIDPPGSDWLRDRLNKQREFSDQLKVTADIERLSYEGMTAVDVSKALSDKLERVAKVAAANDEPPESAKLQFIRDVRTSLGIPAQDQADFQAWRKEYEKRNLLDQERRTRQLQEEKQRAAQEADGFAAGPTADQEKPDEKPVDPSQIISKLLESVTYKARPDGSVLYMVNDEPAFVDHGQHLLMEAKAKKNEEAILAAILLAKEKYAGAFELTGSEEFKRRAIDIMLKYQIDVKLKNPQQDALRRELAKAAGQKPAEAEKPPASRVVIGKKAKSTQDAPDSADAIRSVPSETPEPDAANTDGDLFPVRAVNWWLAQKEAMQGWSQDPSELQQELKNLGPKPLEDQNYWFDKTGKLCDAPANEMDILSKLNINPAGFAPGTEETVAPEAKPVLRGVKKLVDGTYDTTMLLSKGEGDFLQGFVKIGQKKHVVIAHLNNHEGKSNFITLTALDGKGNNKKLTSIGYGNPINERKDGKPVYFDEMLFNVGKEVISARITKHIDDETQQKMGFIETKKPRPVEPESTPGKVSPDKPVAPSTSADKDADAPKATRRARAKP